MTLFNGVIKMVGSMPEEQKGPNGFALLMLLSCVEDDKISTDKLALLLSKL